jgi:DNA-binding transcriptional LysR family regulator
MTPVSPADMLLFAAVVREGGFTRAARKIGVTKQTVSERIAKLEERLGVRLLERTTRRLRVTDTGAVYYERCAAIAAQIDEANSEVLERQAEPVGLLRVSAPVLYGRHFLAPVVAETLARHPRMRVQVVLADRRVDLIEEGFDLAVRIGALDDSSLAAKKLGEGHIYLVASPSFLAARRAPTPETLRELPAISIRANETWTVRGVRTKVEPALVVNDHAVACEAAIAGVGVALLPSLVCREPVLDGRLEILFGPEPAMRSPVYAVFPSRRYVPPKVRVFLEALTALVEPMAPIVVERRRKPRGKGG